MNRSTTLLRTIGLGWGAVMYGLSSILAAILLADCNAPQLPGSTVDPIPQVSRSVTRPGAPRLLPTAKHDALLYISDFYGVHFYSYPQDVHVGDISGFGGTAGGLCSDRLGDVFVTEADRGQAYEFAHGGTTLLNTFSDVYVDFNPIECSVDLSTNTIAIASLDSMFAVVFPHATQSGVAYYDARAVMSECAYDDNGNLFVGAVLNRNHQKKFIGELARGKKKYKNYLLDARITHPGGIKFDGEYITIENFASNIVYRLRFSGSRAIIVGGTHLNGTSYVQQYWIQGNTLIATDGDSTVHFWRYPEGGSPVRSMGGFTDPWGVTVSEPR